MSNTVWVPMSIAVLLLGSVAAPVCGQDLSASSESWAVTMAPYIWFAGLDSTNTVDGLSGSADLSFSDVLGIAKMSLTARTEARKGPWGLILDVTYMDLGTEVRGSLGPINYKLDGVVRNLLTDFAVSYRVHEQSFGHGMRQNIAIDPYAGLRYGFLKQEIELNVDIPLVGPQGTTLRGSEDWVEPFVGGRILWEVGEKVTAGIRGDVGGFGIGSASDLTWNAVAWISYQVTGSIDVGLGYRIMDIDYSRGSGASKFGLDAQADGPLLGVNIYF